MHEFQVMRQVVGMVEEACRMQSGIPSVVKLQISSQSHLAEHHSQALETTFSLASQGTSVQEAKLEIVVIPVNGGCRDCGVSLVWSGTTFSCSQCGSGNLVWEDLPEVVLSEVEYVEVSG